jgi:hypothetical protein
VKLKLILVVFVSFFLINTIFAGAISLSNQKNKMDINSCNSEFLDIAVACHGIAVFYADDAGEYITRKTYNSGGDPVDIITEDFNQDSIPDIAASNWVGGCVNILLGQPEGGFVKHGEYHANVGGHNLVAGNFDSDDYLDLAVLTIGGEYVDIYSFTILFGDGMGGFVNPSSHRLDYIPIDITNGDFNLDDSLDIAITDSKGLVNVYLNTGEGDFEFENSYVVGAGSFGIISGDFNNDGLLDLATCNLEDTSVSILIGNQTESGLFEEYIDYDIYYRGHSLVAGHFNEDDYLDIAVTGGLNAKSISILLSDGTGGFNPYVTFGIGREDPFRITAGDINRDGHTDLAVACTVYGIGGGVSVLFGDSKGNFVKNPIPNYRGGVYSIIVGEFGGYTNTEPATPKITADDGGYNGNPGKTYKYTFSSTDPETHQVKFYIDWGDGTTNETEFYFVETTLSKIYEEEGEYIVKAKAEDIYGAQSDWGQISVKIPKTYQKNKFFAHRLLKQFPILEKTFTFYLF